MTEESTTIDESATDTTQPEEKAAPETDAPDYKAEVEKWKAQARKNEERAKANAEKAKKYDEVEAAAMTAQELAEKRATEAESRAADAEKRLRDAELAVLRDRIGRKVGLPDDIAELLHGEDEESITAHANKLLASIHKPGAPGARPAGSDEPGDDPIRKAMLGLK